MLPRNHPDRIQIAFDDPRLVANAGLILPVTLAGRLGLSQLVDNHVDLDDAPGRANTGDKILTLVASALAGGDCIDDTDVLRAGRTSSVLGCVVKAPSTLGTFLRSFRWGHVRQLDRVSRELLARAWDAGGRPRGLASDDRHRLDGLRDLWAGKGGSAPSQLHRPAGLSSAAGRCRRNRRRADGTTAQGPSQHRPGRSQLPAGDGGASAPRRCHGSAHGAGRQRLLCPHHRCRLSQDGCPLLHHHPTAPPTAQSHRGHTRDGLDTHTLLDGRRSRSVAETIYTPFDSQPAAAPVRLIVRRVKPTPGSQLALFASYSYHGFITDREGDTLQLEADHRRHAEVENAIRDLKYGVGLNHLPSGRFAANAAWLAVQVMAHNLARWTSRIGLEERASTTKTLRRRFFSLAGRLTRSARRLTLHLPQRWPWETQFGRALARLRTIPLPS